ncbi:MAG: sigma-70 family RNA polymerase sigma factor [Peptococcaceae bacterium]|nr:sigma-70 family RNA polymerase sigma factor [Peptococcaceae bacterium]
MNKATRPKAEAKGKTEAKAKIEAKTGRPSLLEEDFQTVLEHYQDLVYRIALTHTRHLQDAQDVFQEVFLIYWRKQPVLHSEEHRQAWLIVTARNCARHITSGSWRQKVLLLDEARLTHEAFTNETSLTNEAFLADEAALTHKTHSQPSKPAYQEFQFQTDEQNEVFNALQNLPEKYRTVLHLFYFEDMPIAQIASTLRIKAGTVKVQLTRGRHMMREHLSD